MLAFGTGIGSALFIRGILVPNTEFGHIEIRGRDAESRASERAKREHDLTWGRWAERVEEYLRHVEALLSPSLIIVGGGVSLQSEKWVPRLTGIRAPIVPAALQNDAGIVGAAMSTASSAGPRHRRPQRNRPRAAFRHGRLMSRNHHRPDRRPPSLRSRSRSRPTCNRVTGRDGPRRAGRS